MEAPDEGVGVGMVCTVPVGMRPARKDLERRAAVVRLRALFEDGEVVRRSRHDADICFESLHEYPGSGDEASDLS